jgi:hypothetical protein
METMHEHIAGKDPYSIKMMQKNSAVEASKSSADSEKETQSPLPQSLHMPPQQLHPAMLIPPNAFAGYYHRLPGAIPAYNEAHWRKGKWLDEEIAYSQKLIEAFNAGYLSLSSGTTLRSFLSERLSW